jgi:Proteasome maturation factor UMP1
LPYVEKYYAEEEMKMRNCSVLYGSGLAMRMAMERHVHGQPTRLPGLKSSYLGLEVMMNKLGSLEFEDYLGQD